MGFGRVIGGALQGYGKGMADVARSAEEERRQIALENLRAANDSQARTETADLQDRNSARDTQRRTSADVIKIGMQGEAQAAADARRYQYETQDREDKQAHDIETARIASQLRKSEDATARAQAAEIDREKAAGTLDRVEVAEDGSFIKFYRDGSTRRVGGARATPKAIYGSRSAGDEGGVLGAVRQQAGQQSPAPRTKPAQSSKDKANTYTMADLRELMKQSGMSEAEARAWAKSQGMVLSN